MEIAIGVPLLVVGVSFSAFLIRDLII